MHDTCRATKQPGREYAATYVTRLGQGNHLHSNYELLLLSTNFEQSGHHLVAFFLFLILFSVPEFTGRRSRRH